MDRRIQKSRKAIFQAFLELLEEKDYEKMTVQAIIERANVGRTTFYSHFATKDILLESICTELFQHVFVDLKEKPCLEEAVLHLLKHFYHDKDGVATLLLRENPYFLKSLSQYLDDFLCPLLLDVQRLKNISVPQDLLKSSLKAHFTESIKWWLRQQKHLSPEEICHYFLRMIE